MVKYRESDRCAHLMGAVLLLLIAMWTNGLEREKKLKSGLRLLVRNQKILRMRDSFSPASI